MNLVVITVTEKQNALKIANVKIVMKLEQKLITMHTTIRMTDTKDTGAEQRLEIMIKIAHQFLQELIKFCERNQRSGITADEIIKTRGVNFDMVLTEPLGVNKEELAMLMRDGVIGIASMLVKTMKNTNTNEIPLRVLKDFENRWDWKAIFKSVMADKT